MEELPKGSHKERKSMFSSYVRKMQPAALSAAAIVSLVVFGQLFAQDASVKLPNVTYTASGTFSGTVVSGQDLFKLAGEPFKINLVANEATRPQKTGKGWADYSSLKMKGVVTSNLVPQSPFTIESAHAFMVQALGNTHDLFQLAAPVVVVKQKITLSAKFTMPKGTYGKGWLIYPFTAPVALTPASGTVTYSDGTNSTVLTVASGALNAVKGAPAE
jgi:hypothetical protein